jgi:general secretion pathway protein G
MLDKRLRAPAGFSLLELMIVVVVVGLLATLAVPAYNGFIDKARIKSAIGDIGSLHIKLEEFRIKNNDQLPANLNELNIDVPLDPWGEPYEYLNIQAAGPGAGGLRKDGQLNPLNTDYDLYSLGADGSSSGPLSARASRDDIVRANNGAFIGLGEDY